METHSLPPRPTNVDQPPLADGRPAIRVELRERTVVAANGRMAELVGRGVEEIVGSALAGLWAPDERSAIVARFDDAVLLGQDVFGALALMSSDTVAAWVEADARFSYHGGQRLDVVFTPLALRDAGDAIVVVPGDAASAAEPDPKPDPTSDVASATVMATLEAACAPALWVDASGTVVSATRDAGKELGMEVADIRGRALHDVVALSDPAREALAVAREGRMRQTVLDGGDASERKHVVEWVPGSERGAGFVVFSRPGARVEGGDTERLRFQSQLVSHVSHDLRGAMAAVFCGLQVVADGLSDGDPLQASVRQALDDSRRANRIIDEVLAVSRPGRQKRVEVDLGALLRRTLGGHRQTCDAKSIAVDDQVGEDHHITGDPSALERAFGNVIENALQATPEGGTLDVSTRAEARVGPGVLVSISDSGTGIPAELQPNVFEPFVSNRDGGTGLGLAITRRIVLEHGGQIDFETVDGDGTTFHIWLPCTP